MADSKFTFDKDKLLAHLGAIEKHYLQFAGKKGHNPFVFLVHKLDPLKKRLAGGETTETLHKEILALDTKHNTQVVTEVKEPTPEVVSHPALQMPEVPGQQKSQS